MIILYILVFLSFFYLAIISTLNNIPNNPAIKTLVYTSCGLLIYFNCYIAYLARDLKDPVVLGGVAAIIPMIYIVYSFSRWPTVPLNRVWWLFSLWYIVINMLVNIIYVHYSMNSFSKIFKKK